MRLRQQDRFGKFDQLNENKNMMMFGKSYVTGLTKYIVNFFLTIFWYSVRLRDEFQEVSEV